MWTIGGHALKKIHNSIKTPQFPIKAPHYLFLRTECQRFRKKDCRIKFNVVVKLSEVVDIIMPKSIASAVKRLKRRGKDLPVTTTLKT